jgi:uncharacterized delta-60 repeat protein
MSKFKLFLSFLFLFFFSANLIYSQQVIQDWVSRYNGTSNDQDYSYAIAVDANGNAYITGQSFSSSALNDIVTIKYNPAGAAQWIQIYNGSFNLNDIGIGIKVDNTGNVYVTGNTDTMIAGATYSNIVTIKYDPSGVLLWNKIYDGPWRMIDKAHGIALDNAGNIYITGESYAYQTYDYVTIKYDPAGNKLWDTRYYGKGNNDVATSIVVDNSNNVIVSGYSYNSGNLYDYATVKYNSNSIQQWEQRYEGSGNDIARSIAVDNSGNICVTGSSFRTGTGNDYLTILYNPSGVQKWLQEYNDVSNGSDEAFSTAFDNFGNVYITGNSPGNSTTADFATIKYNPAGVMQWIQKYNGIPTGADYARSLAVDGQGNVYVTGYSSGIGSGYDYATIKYNTEGLLKWVQRYNGLVYYYDLPTMVVVDASNSVFVTGYSWGGSSLYDMASVKYYQCNLVVNAGNDTTIYKGYGSGTVTLRANITGGVNPISFVWSTGATTQTITLSPSQTTPYWVRATDAKGCISSDTVIVNVIDVSCGTPGNNKVLVCHKGNTICVNESAVPAHLAHGDYLGSCIVQKSVFDQTSSEYKLYPNYPNPFNPSTKIMFNLPEQTKVKVVIYDVIGREVAVLVNGELKAGIQSVTWDAANYSSGIYFYKITAGTFSEIKKMLLVK